MAVAREVMVQEGVERMKILKMLRNPIREFENGKLNLSERFGALYWLDEEQDKMVRKWEAEHDAVVYHVIHDYTDFGELFTLLFVSKHQEEWAEEREWLRKGFPFTYVINKDFPHCSEYGSCQVKPSIGGVRRVFG